MDKVLESIEVILDYMSYRCNDVDGIDEKTHHRLMRLLSDYEFHLRLSAAGVVRSSGLRENVENSQAAEADYRLENFYASGL